MISGCCQKIWARDYLRPVAEFLLVLFAFTLPLATSATLILSYSIVFIWLVDKNPIDRWLYTFNYPLIKPLLLIAAVNVAGTSYTIASWEEGRSALYQVYRLSFIPIFAYYLQDASFKFKKTILYAFVLAMVVTAICAFLKVYGGVPIGQRTYGNDVFKNHIVVSYFMATALFLLWSWLITLKHYRMGFMLLIGICLFHFLFLNTGRIGYVVASIYFMVFAWHRYQWKGIWVSSFIVCLTTLLAYQFSNVFAHRFNECLLEFGLYLQGTSISSIGARLDYATNAIQLFLQHPLFGLGTGSFPEAYALQVGQFGKLTGDPHNQYLKMAVELGLMGLLCLFYLFYKQWKMIQQLTGFELILAKGLFLAFYIGCFFNSWLHNFTECHFYFLMAAYFTPSMLKNEQPVVHPTLASQSA
ncbi:O-antigen ligase family protein [Candidatus Berkiella aquae]|uniref:O-Antigen ligase n=1 Tax=Candidatus Berkiella aquae TaxID=295108 RepID=A0A0Q9YZD8_9GAMM|nr:O-antigen ligase family protein [Candidatus Berkiella aquae]MCS5712449.1 O-antigen ligase family protein [Candidatus Berkiella aquae]